MLAALALLAAACAALRLEPDVLDQFYTPTPQGYVLRHCVHSVRPHRLQLESRQIKSENTINQFTERQALIARPNAAIIEIISITPRPRAHRRARWRPARILCAARTARWWRTSPAATASSPSVRPRHTTAPHCRPSTRRCPPTTTVRGWQQAMTCQPRAGWLAYTVFNYTSFDAFLGNFSVPNIPKSTPQVGAAAQTAPIIFRLAHRHAQVIYLFTGLQNIDWIPKARPFPPRLTLTAPGRPREPGRALRHHPCAACCCSCMLTVRRRARAAVPRRQRPLLVRQVVVRQRELHRPLMRTGL